MKRQVRCLLTVLIGALLFFKTMAKTMATSSSSSSPMFQSVPIDDTTGLLFEQIYSMRHLTVDRFVFIQRINYLPMLHNLEFMRNKITEHQKCGYYTYNQYLYGINNLIGRFKDYLSNIKALDKNYITYKSTNMISNKIINCDNDAIDCEYDKNIRSKSKSAIDSGWGKLDAETAKILLSSKSTLKNYLVKFFPEMHTEILDLSETKPINGCDASEKVISDVSSVISNSTQYTINLQSLINNVRDNKLNNNIISDDKLLKEMKNQGGLLKKHQRDWVNNKKIKNEHYNLSQAYKLHLFLDEYSIILFIVMPLVNESNINYNIYHVMTVPFCKGKTCLFMIPNNEYIAVSETKNYYIPLKKNFLDKCTIFTGNDEYLCPESKNLPTINSQICEIEMYMGRFTNVMNKYCDLRLGALLVDTQYVNSLIDHRKWLYMFQSRLNVDFYCKSNNVGSIFTVSSGIGILSAIKPEICSVRIGLKTTLLSNPRFYRTQSTTYWPKKKI